VDYEESGASAGWQDAAHVWGLDLPTLAQAGKHIQRTDAGLRIDGFTLTENGLLADDDVTQAQWSALGELFRQFSKTMRWWIGDWMNAADEQWGDKYTAAMALTGLKYGSLRNLAYVCGSVDLSWRHDKLTIQHGLLIAPLDDEAKEYFAQQIAEQGWSVRRLMAEIAASKGEQVDAPPSTAVAAKRVLTAMKQIASALNAQQRIDPAHIAAVRDWLSQVEASGLVTESEGH
jgi:hypothetical protein